MITMSLETLRDKYEQATSAGDVIFTGILYQGRKSALGWIITT